VDRSDPNKKTEQDSKPMSRAEQVRKVLDYRDQRQRSYSETMLQKSKEFGKPNGKRFDRRRYDVEQDSKSRQMIGAQYVPIDLFGAKPLGIFTKQQKSTVSGVEYPKLDTWDAIHAKELKMSTTHPPTNGFEEMILWTEQGKLWKFPINNEHGNACI